MTVSSPVPLETLLAQAHAQPGEPQARLSRLLSALEDADFTLLLGGQDALALQLAFLLGPGLIRVDPRLSVPRELFAAAGLALASSDGDWKGARAVWLLEPDERSLTRARRLDVPVIVDATLAPGGRWLTQGAELVVYRDAVTLTGYEDVTLSAVSGLGSRPRRVAAAPADLGVALALRDIGTLALRMNRRTRNAEQLLPRFGGRALPVSGGVLLLEHDGPSTVTPLGGNLSAARSVTAGTLVTVGIESPDDAWAVLGEVLTREARPAGQRRRVGVEDGADDSDSSAGDGTSTEDLADDLIDDSQELQPLPEATGSEAAPALPAGPMPVQTREDQAQAAAQADAAQPDTAPPPAEDFSDREFVFSPLPSLPSVPSQVSRPDQPSAPVPTYQDPIDEDTGRPGRRGRGRGRGRAGGGADAVQASAAPADMASAPAVQPEIVMSESFSRPPEAEQTEPALTGAGLTPAISDEQPADQWPEELAGAETDVSGPAVQPETQPEPLPLQLPPDLPQGAATPATEGLTDEQQAIFARLREWRNAEARRQAVSSFIIASNATLAEVARRIPYTEADLKAVRGMGPERLRKYGEKILEVVRG